MKIKKTYLLIALILLVFTGFLFLKYIDIDLKGKREQIKDFGSIKDKWGIFSSGKKGKLIYAVPPDMFILYLHSGINRKIDGIRTEGGPGRFNRGKTPRPFWNSSGSYFVYRYRSYVYLSDENGKKRIIFNKLMDRSKETRWSFTVYKGKEWIFGPSLKKTGILVDPKNPDNFIEIFKLPEIDKHCEMTADGKHMVYDNGKDIFLKKIDSSLPGIKISEGQSCRPCASPGKFVGWLGAPHIKYLLFYSKNGKLFKELSAPPNEELYRLNWSNYEKYAVHMFGSRGNTKITVRNIENGDSLYTVNGWDPDLWIEN